MKSSSQILPGILCAALLAASSQAMAASAVSDTVFPEGLCGILEDVTDAGHLAYVRQAAPYLFEKTPDGSYQPKKPLKQVPGDTALELVGKAAGQKWGAVDFVTEPGFQTECTYYLPKATLAAMNKAYYMGMIMPIADKDRDDKPFHMRALVAGEKLVAILYDRGETEYYSQKTERYMKFPKTVRFKTHTYQSADGPVKLLQEIRKLEIHTGFPYGWEDLEKIGQWGGKSWVWVLDKWRGGNDSSPIQARKGMKPRIFERPSIDEIDPLVIDEPGPRAPVPHTMADSSALDGSLDSPALEDLRRIQGKPSSFDAL